MNDTFRIAIVARMKHGVLYEAIKKKGWTNKQAAEFLEISQSKMGQLINLKGRPPFLFSKSKTPKKYRQKVKRLSERLMELTGVSVEDLFPEEILTDEFLSRSKIIEGVRDIPKQILIESGAVPRVLPAPDEMLLHKEARQELLEMVEELPSEQRFAVKGLYFEGKTAQELSKEIGVGASAIFAAAHKGYRYLEERIGHRVITENTKPWLNPKSIKGRVNSNS